MKTKIRLILSLILIITGSVVLDAATTSADFLKLESGARSSALGESGVATLSGIDGFNLNPALIAGGNLLQFGVQYAMFYSTLDSGLNQGMFSAAVPLDKLVQGKKNLGSIGVGVSYLTTAAFASYDDWGQVVNESAGFSAITASLLYAQSFVHSLDFDLDGGMMIRYLNVTLDGDHLPVDLTLDGGLCAKIVLNSESLSKILGKSLNMGFSAQNIYFQPGSDYSAAPINFRVGLGLSPVSGLGVNIDSLISPVAAPEFLVGAEYLIKNVVSVRVGSKMGAESNKWFSAGLGAQFNLLGKKVMLDYSAVPDLSFGFINRIGLQVK